MSERRTIILNSLLTLILVAAIYQFVKIEFLSNQVGTIDRNMQTTQRQIAQLTDAASSSFEQTMRRFDDFGRQLSTIAPAPKKTATPTVAQAQPGKRAPVGATHLVKRVKLPPDLRRDQEAKLNRDLLQFSRLRSQTCVVRGAGKAADVRTRRCEEGIERLARRGNSAAQKWLAAEARDQQQNLQTAVTWLERAAAQGDTEAMNALAAIYAGTGRSSENDAFLDGAKALYWYSKSASLEDANAMGAIAAIYEEGRLTTQNQHESIVWYELAAESAASVKRRRTALSNFAAMLGDVYYHGTGGEPDKVQAYEWYIIACTEATRINRPADPSCVSRDKVAIELSPVDAAKAQALAAEWQKLHR